MLALFRRFLNTWPARLFFLLLVASFALWGVADVVRNVGNDGSLASIGGRKIEPQEFEESYRRALAQVSRMFGGQSEPTPQIRRAVAEQTMDRLLIQAALQQEARSLGIAVPDDALRQAVFDIPAFRTPAGFSRPQFEGVLRNNGLTEGRFLELMRVDLAQQQLVGSVRAGIVAPDVVARHVFAYQQEKRVGEYVDLPLTAANDPESPSPDDLRRHYENNPALYSAPAFRRVKTVILAPETMAKEVTLSDDDLRLYYEAHKADYVTPEKRSVQVVVTPTEDAARALFAQWSGGADWGQVEAAARAAGASPVVLDDATQVELPDAELARAVFAAPPDTVAGPVHGALGWQVLRVTKVSPGESRALDAARDEVRGKLALERAADLVYERARTVEEILAAGKGLQDLPGDLGLAAVSGTLDRDGNTPAGEPAPLPGGPQLRQALLTTAFQVNKGDPAQLVEAPDHSWYAVEVEDATASALKPFEEVEASVREDWLRVARLREQEIVAAKLLAAVQGGQTLDDATTVAGLRMQRTPPVGRSAPPPGVSQPVAQALFGLKQHEATMVQGTDGFTVLVLADIQAPVPEADQAAFAQAKTVIGRALADDVEMLFAGAVRDGLAPRVNRPLLDGYAER